jgi:hypothetical protein
MKWGFLSVGFHWNYFMPLADHFGRFPVSSLEFCWEKTLGSNFVWSVMETVHLSKNSEINSLNSEINSLNSEINSLKSRWVSRIFRNLSWNKNSGFGSPPLLIFNTWIFTWNFLIFDKLLHTVFYRTNKSKIF